jgi:hypothetical protein
MKKALEKERKKRMRGTIPETIRVILGEYLSVQKIEHKTRTKTATRRWLDTGWGTTDHIVQDYNFPSNA